MLSAFLVTQSTETWIAGAVVVHACEDEELTLTDSVWPFNDTVQVSFVAVGIALTVKALWTVPAWKTVVWPRSIGGGVK